MERHCGAAIVEELGGRVLRHYESETTRCCRQDPCGSSRRNLRDRPGCVPAIRLLQTPGCARPVRSGQSSQPDPEYVETALTALAEACLQLDVPEASIVFVDTVVPPPAFGLRFGFKGAFTTDYPANIWVFANWTSLAELRDTVRHEAAHLAFARTHTAEESAGHSGPSEDFALAFEQEPASADPVSPP